MFRFHWCPRPVAISLSVMFFAVVLASCSARESAFEPATTSATTTTTKADQPAIVKVPDADRDKVPDSSDLCPNKAEDSRWSAGTDGCPDTVDDLVAFATSDIDTFWESVFAAEGERYVSPRRVAAYTGRERTGCGASLPGNAFYCANDNSIYYDESLIEDVFKSNGDFAPVFVIAHEWGHLVQQHLGILSNPRRQNIQNELQADCFAGFYTQDAESRKLLEAGDVEEAKMMAIAAGDPAGTRRNSGDAHGTSKQRVAAFQSGYTGGLKACLAI